MVLLFMRLALSAERLCVGIETPKNPHQIAIAHSQFAPPRTERRSVGCLFRSETPITTARVARAESTATGMSDRSKAGCAMCDHHADRASLFAFHADTVRRRIRLAAVQKRTEHFYQLVFVDGTATQL